MKLTIVVLQLYLLGFFNLNNKEVFNWIQNSQSKAVWWVGIWLQMTSMLEVSKSSYI